MNPTNLSTLSLPELLELRENFLADAILHDNFATLETCARCVGLPYKLPTRKTYECWRLVMPHPTWSRKWVEILTWQYRHRFDTEANQWFWNKVVLVSVTDGPDQHTSPTTLAHKDLLIDHQKWLFIPGLWWDELLKKHEVAKQIQERAEAAANENMRKLLLKELGPWQEGV